MIWTSTSSVSWGKIVIEALTQPVLTGIAEYDCNPLISRLPPPLSISETYEALKRFPDCREHERRLAPHLRQQLVVLRLRKLFIPTTTQIVFAQKVGMLVRAGYDGVSMEDPAGVRRLAGFIDQVESGRSIQQVTSAFAPTAYCGSLIGPSGMGKTTVAKAALGMLPQVVDHVEPATFKQLVFLRIECPSSGSPKQLCIAFLEAVDKVLGTDYYRKFSGVAADHLMLRVAHVAQLHRLGLLVVDEIQFLNDAKVGKEDVLNFLTTLVNVINVPVMLVGTTASFSLLTSTFRNARRADGVGSAMFDRMQNNAEWREFVRTLLRFQWTSELTEYSDGLADALWEASQGIVDIVMKIFMIAQVRLMRASEVRKTKEVITPRVIEKVVKEDLRIVRGMLQALRNPKSKSFARLDDLRPLDQAFENILGAHYAGQGAIVPAEAVTEEVSGGDMGGTLARTLAAMGFAPDAATLMVADACEQVPSGDPVQMLEAVMKSMSKRGTSAEPVDIAA